MRRALAPISIAVFLAMVALLCASKIADFDFFWHVAAGRWMLEHGALPATDPFAFTRAGLPYLATHEWLAQVIFASVFRLGGAAGIILLRTVLVAGTFALLLSLDLQRLWINVPLAVLGVGLALPGFVDRPQLFTFLLFAVDLVLALQYLESAEHDRAKHIRLFLGMGAVQLLWINLHGGAAVLGLVVFAAMFLERTVGVWRSGWKTAHQREVVRLALTGLVLFFLLFASPSGFENLSYLWSLIGDRTVHFIREWEPRPLGAYLRSLGVLWGLALGALVWTRQRWIFCGLLLILTGLLSRQAFRHEMLFVIAALGILFFELRWNAAWGRWTERFATHPERVLTVFLLLLLGTSTIALRSARALERPQDLFGYGTFSPARSATDFLEREGIRGNLFNSYELGGYLEERGFPVFMDGRNVDFGFAFLKAAFDAAQNEDLWKALEAQYDLSVAVLYYDPLADLSPMPYIDDLEKRPDWSLVFLDDWVAVYVKDTPEHHGVIARNRYALLTPHGLETASVLERLTDDRATLLGRELLRTIARSPDALKPRLVLARLSILVGLTSDAAGILQDAAQRWSSRYEPIELLAALYATQGKWREAGELYEEAIRRAGDRAAGIDYAVLAEMFEKAGDGKKVEKYRRLKGL